MLPAAPRTDLAEATAQAFDQHPDAQILAGFPGIGPVTGAPVLGELGDDRARFRDARGFEVLCRRRADHHRLGKEPGGAPSQGQESAAPRSGLRLNLRRSPHPSSIYLPDDDLARLVVPLLVAMLSSQHVVRHGSLGAWQGKEHESPLCGPATSDCRSSTAS